MLEKKQALSYKGEWNKSKVVPPLSIRSHIRPFIRPSKSFPLFLPPSLLPFLSPSFSHSVCLSICLCAESYGLNCNALRVKEYTMFRLYCLLQVCQQTLEEGIIAEVLCTLYLCHSIAAQSIRFSCLIATILTVTAKCQLVVF